MSKSKVTVTLTAYNMGGNATEADFDAWASWVAAHVDEACQVDAAVDQHPFRGGPAKHVVTSGDEDAAERVTGWLSHEAWDAWCSAGAL